MAENKADFTEIDKKLKLLRDNADAWTQVSFEEKVNILKEINDLLGKHSGEWVDRAVEGKKIDKSIASEEVQGGVYPTTRLVKLLIESYEPAVAAEKAGKPITFKKPGPVKKVGDQKIVQVYPLTTLESLMFPGLVAESYLEPNKDETQGTELLEAKKSGKGQVGLVLGAGNQSSIPFMDALYKLYNQNQVVMLKHNPVADWVYPVMEKIFEPLIKRNFLHHVKGGIAEGAYLTEKCDNVHITGSDKTHDAIVWGKQDKKTAKKPNFEKEITSELGCVSPFIIVPGQLTDAELNYVAQHVLGAVISNNSCNCNAAKVLVLDADWKQRGAFLKLIKEGLAKIPPRYAYYPGSHQRYAGFMDRYKQAEPLSPVPSDKKDTHIPWTFIENVPAEQGEYALCNEPFCPIISEISIKTKGTDDFIKEAVKTANNKIWGNLTCSLFVDPRTEKQFKNEVEQAISDLKYGGVAVNCWSGVLYGLGTPVWGAFPGNPLQDIQSGRGFVHNSLLLDHVQKSVARAPHMLLMGSKYPYFPSHSNSENFMKELANFENGPSYYKFVKTMWNGLFA